MANDKDSNTSRIIAAAVTALAVLVILLMLMFSTIGRDRAALASASIPEEPADEELFIDPELTDLGEPEPLEESLEAAPSPQGEPEQGPDNNEKVDPGPAEKPLPQAENVIKQQKPSPVQSPDTKKTDKKESKIAQSMQSKFSPKNGKHDGKHGSTGAGGKGSGVSGNLNGRSFIGCPLPKGLKLKETVRVVISVTVDASGHVTKATYKSGSAASAEIRRACERSAMQARWTEKPGQAEQRGTLTFTIVPVI